MNRNENRSLSRVFVALCAAIVALQVGACSGSSDKSDSTTVNVSDTSSADTTTPSDSSAEDALSTASDTAAGSDLPGDVPGNQDDQLVLPDQMPPEDAPTPDQVSPPTDVSDVSDSQLPEDVDLGDALTGDVDQAGEMEFCVVYVKKAGDNGQDGLTWDTAVASLQRAMDIASALLPKSKSGTCDVWVETGEFNLYDDPYPKPGLAHEAGLYLVSNVSIYGGFEATESTKEDRNPALRTVLNGASAQGAQRLVSVISGDGVDKVTLDRLVVIGGGSVESVGSRGGGLRLKDPGEVTVSGSLFMRNEAELGGAINVENSDDNPSCNLRIFKTYFAQNQSAEHGGALRTFSCDLRVEDSVFSGNLAGGDGGAIHHSFRSLTIDRVALAGNTGANGGGIFATASGANVPSSVTVSSSILIGNHALLQGGGLSFDAIASAGLFNVTIVKNVADFLAPALKGLGTNLTIYNAIIINPGDAEMVLVSQSNLTVEGTNIDDGAISQQPTNQNLDPYFYEPAVVTTSTWTAVTYDANSGLTTLVSATMTWEPDAFVGKFVQPDTNSPRVLHVIGNDTTSIRVMGDWSGQVKVGAAFQLLTVDPTVLSPGIDLGVSDAAPDKDYYNTDWTDSPGGGTFYDQGAIDYKAP